ncbi:cysteine--tRNA ligase [bacterium]|nr:cysteine--tRNA ligase [bacterium]RQV92112.1 MAG: cysteine--tRNA ligase [bacterium]
MLKIYNTLTRKKEKFVPLHPPFVGMYVCGPTVYDDPHLGHAKTYISFDVIVRFLRESGYHVRYIQNITDVGHLLGDEQEGEDRILKRAKIEKLEPAEIAYKYEVAYFRDMDLLNCLRPDISCRATGHVPEMIELVEKLIKKGYGYEVGGNVYFDVSRFKGYGKLSGRRVEELVKGSRVKVAEDKRHPADFALWKKADPQHLMQWPSPWGRGFPGWHLECSVMGMKYLGDSIDIHGGGLDNQFPHHECEIAQSEAATGKPFVKYWLHNNMLTIDGQKMSKSLGNHVTLAELFQKYDPMIVRFFVLQGHYRSPQDFSDKALDAARSGFERLKNTVLGLRRLLIDEIEMPKQMKEEKWNQHQKKFYHFMNDDFNTSGAISVLFDIVKDITSTDGSGFVVWGPNPKEELNQANALFKHLGEDILGLKFEEEANQELEDDLIQLLIQQRERFRKQKEWEKADEIRDSLEKIGIILEDGKEGTKYIKK